MKMLPVMLAFVVAFPVYGTPLQEAADDYVNEARRTPAVAMSLVTPDGVERAIAGPDSLTAASLFEIGSITKVFTGVLLAEMVARDAVSFDTTIGEILGDAWSLDAAVASITLEELATHTSGLPRLPMGLAMMGRIFLYPADPYQGLTTERLFDDLAAVRDDQLSSRGGFNYSNFGMAVLGRVLEHAVGESYEQLLRQRVLLPLGLEGMGFTDDVIGDGALVRGHRSNLQPTAHWRFATYAPMGGLVGNLEHLERFLVAAMQAEPGSPIAVSIDKQLGWARSERDGRVMIWHNGQTGGFHSFLGFDPDAGHGVVVLSNAANNGDAYAVSVLRGEPSVSRARPGWVALGFTILFPFIGPLILFGYWKQPQSRLHIVDGLLAAIFTLAITWKLAAWATVPIALWYAAAAASVVFAALAVPGMLTAPWVPQGKPWTTAGKLLSVASFAVASWWALVRL